MSEPELYHWPIDKLIEYARNPRKNDQAVDRIAAAIKEFGFRVPIIAKSDGSVVDGHLRLKAAKKLKLETVPVLLADDMTDIQIKAFRLSVNKMAELAEWDTELLALELQELIDEAYDVAMTGFSQEELDALLNVGVNGLMDEDAVPEVPDDPVTQLGDVWILDSHRVMCGDSTDAGTVALLMDGAKADMVFTDPPYRMDAQGGSNQPIGRAAAKLGESIKHLCDFDPVMFLEVLPTAFSNKKMNSYIFCNKDLVPDYLNWGKEKGYSFNILFWKKPNAIPLGKQHRPDVEYLLVFRKSAIWNDAQNGVNYSKCLEHGRESGLHPTMKPVSMIENQLLISSNKNSPVLDLFGGSGSTLIACEKTGRICYMMELDPIYCDIIVKRWEDFTGKHAKLESKRDTEDDGKNTATGKEERPRKRRSS